MVDASTIQTIFEVIGGATGGASGVVTAIKTEMPGLRWVKRLLISEEDAWKRVVFNAPHPVAVVRTVQQAGGEFDYNVKRVSERAASFYATGLDKVVGWSAREELQQLQHYMDPGAYQDFIDDQAEVADVMKAGGHPYAKVPVRFNDKHPCFPRQSFLPIVVSIGHEKKTARRIETDITLMYLNVDRAILGLNVGLGPDRLDAAPTA